MSPRNDIENFIKRHPKIGVDTNVLIALIEEHADYGHQSEAVFTSLGRFKSEVWFSVISVTEVLIQPIRQQNIRAKRDYEARLFNSPYSFANLDLAVSQTAAVIGGRYGLKVIDALIIASLLQHQVTGFVTADADLKRVEALEVFVIA